MFGKYKHTLDPKGRLFVPAKLREELGSAFYVARSLDPCLTVYTEEEWQRIVERSKAAPSSKARGLRRAASCCRTTSANRPGSSRRSISSGRPAALRSGRQSATRRKRPMSPPRSWPH